MCKIVGREGIASLVVIPALVWKISQENERGDRNSPPPPVGRGLSHNLNKPRLQLEIPSRDINQIKLNMYFFRRFDKQFAIVSASSVKINITNLAN